MCSVWGSIGDCLKIGLCAVPEQQDACNRTLRETYSIKNSGTKKDSGKQSEPGRAGGWITQV
ncbi:hypothetical protein GCM10027256_08050 [Novispirillum itersonii subsp. nipponicum]